MQTGLEAFAIVLLCKLSHKYEWPLQMKKVFSANPEATINVECIMNDIDVGGRLTRDVFEEKSASVLQRARAPLQKVQIKHLVLFRSLLLPLMTSPASHAQCLLFDIFVKPKSAEGAYAHLASWAC